MSNDSYSINILIEMNTIKKCNVILICYTSTSACSSLSRPRVKEPVADTDTR